MKNFILFLSMIWFSPIKSQVGINTTTPNSATILDVVSNSKGILIPRLSESERNTSLADNNLSTIPPIGVANSSLSVGT